MKDNKFTRLPIQVGSLFNNAHEWSLIDYLYYRSNIDGFIINISDLQKNTPIKSNKTVLRILNRLAKRGWIIITPIGTSGKHHKYSFNKSVFNEWLDKVSNDTSLGKFSNENCEKVSNDTSAKCQTTPNKVSNDTVQQITSTIKQVPIKNSTPVILSTEKNVSKDICIENKNKELTEKYAVMITENVLADNTISVSGQKAKLNEYTMKIKKTRLQEIEEVFGNT